MVKKKQFKTFKHYFTLLETLIALTLLSVLLTIIFGLFRELSFITTQIGEREKESFQMRYVEMRLNGLFQRIVNEKEATKRKFYFYTQPAEEGISNQTSLIFTFNNKARANPNFSDDILARLYVDEHHQLVLVTWPIYSEQPHREMQKEILLQNVRGMSFQFYAAPERQLNQQAVTGTPVDPEKKTPEKDQWHSEWLKTYAQMPSILRLTVDIASDPEALKDKQAQNKLKETKFAFVLPSSQNYIYYPNEK
jgi:type II secretory pathway component PulJ